MAILPSYRSLFIVACSSVFFAFAFKAELKESQTVEPGMFSCNFNGKDIFLKGLKAEYRTITGGFKQLSLSNNKFSSFVFIDPAEKTIILSPTSNREAFVRYKEPGTDKVFKPIEGQVHITSLDMKNKVVSGSFEMVLVNNDGSNTKIKVSSGKFHNIPIVDISGY